MNFDKEKTIPRYFAIIVMLTLFGLAILGKATYEMFFRQNYWEAVRERMASQQKDIPAARGNIYSSDGQLMVGSMPVYNFHMDFVIKDKNDSLGAARAQCVRDSLFILELDSMCIGLHQVFPDESVADFKRKFLEGKQKGMRDLVFRKNVSYIQYKACLQIPFLRYNVQKNGFYTTNVPMRKKPYGSLATRTLGSLYAADASPKNGLELAFDSILRGENGKRHKEKVRNYWMDKTDVEPIDGLDLITTIDVGMQDAAEKAIVKKLKEVNGEIGVVVLMEVATGDVKAIVNMTKMPDGEYAELRNNAVSDLWEPGSTFKTASIMVALEDGAITKDDFVETGNGQWMMHGRNMKDHNWRRGGYGRISVPEVLMYSSNVGVSRIIDDHYKDHPEKYVDGLYREGVGVTYDINIPGQAYPKVRRPKPDGSNWSKTALPWMSIGYETQIPPIYTVAFYNAIANNGRMVKPRFVKEIQKDGITVKEFPVEVVKEKICSPHTLHDIQTILEMVVNHPKGLGRKAGCKQFKVSGKTGTAQVADEHGSYHSGTARYMVSFCGYFPSEAPKYSCIVCIKKSGLPASGGAQCGPVFSEIAQAVMAKGVFRPATDAADSTSILKAPAPKEVHDTLQTIVPDVTGLCVRDAVRLLEKRGMKVRIHGQGYVKSQSIHAGTKAQKKQTITLNLAEQI